MRGRARLLRRFALVSLVCFVPLAVLWAQSHLVPAVYFRVRDQVVGRDRRLYSEEVHSVRGRLIVLTAESFVVPYVPPPGQRGVDYDPPDPRFPPIDHVPAVTGWAKATGLPHNALRGQRDAAPAARGTPGPLHWGTRMPRHFELGYGPWAALFGLLPAYVALDRLNEWLRSKEPRAGRCPTCGYDVRATPDRCPECGELRPGGR